MKKLFLLMFVLLSYSIYAKCEIYDDTSIEEEVCDGLDNDCDGRIDELSTCCNPLVSPRRECKINCLDGSEALGYVSCVNYMWNESCSASCLIQQGTVAINFPQNEGIIEFCKEDKIPSYSIDYQGSGQCTYKLNNNAYMSLTKDTRFTPKLGENRLIVKCGLTVESKFYVEEIPCNNLSLSKKNTDIILPAKDEIILEKTGFFQEEQNLEPIENKEDEKRESSFFASLYEWFIGLFKR